MLVKFNNSYLEKIFTGSSVVGKPKYSSGVILKFKKTILMLQYVENLIELKKFRGLNFEALKGEYKGYYSVRVDIQYRLILSVQKDEIFIKDILIVEDLSNHYQ